VRASFAAGALTGRLIGLSIGLLTLLSSAACSYLPWGNQSEASAEESTTLKPSSDTLQVGAPRATPTPSHSAPFAITSGPDRAVWFGEFSTGHIGRMALDGEVKLFSLSAVAERMTAGPDEAVWFTDPASNRIGRISREGEIVFVKLLVENAGPAGITLGPDGNLWFTESIYNHHEQRNAQVAKRPLGGFQAGIRYVC